MQIFPPSCMEGAGALHPGPTALKKTFEKQALGLNEVLRKRACAAKILQWSTLII